MSPGLKLALVGTGAFLVGHALGRRRGRREAPCSVMLVGKSMQQVHRAQIYPHRTRAWFDRMQRSTGRKLPVDPRAYRPNGSHDLDAHARAIRGNP